MTLLAFVQRIESPKVRVSGPEPTIAQAAGRDVDAGQEPRQWGSMGSVEREGQPPRRMLPCWRAADAAVPEPRVDPDAIIGHAPDGTIKAWNSGAETMLGYTAQEAIGKPITMLLPEDLHGEVARLLEGLQRGERPHPLDAEWIRKDRSRVRVSASISLLMVEDAMVISWFARDVSERSLAASDQDIPAAAKAAK